ncbi:MAG: FkbM family methyltransferase [Sulfolobales archaeon]
MVSLYVIDGLLKRVIMIRKLREAKWLRELRVRDRKVKILLNPKDRGLSLELALWGFREPLSGRLFIENLRSDDIVLDIGSNIGYYAIQEAVVVERGLVYAFEPVEENRVFLHKNIRINDLNNVIVYDYAISSSSGFLNMCVSREKNTSHIILLAEDLRDCERVEKVKALSLKELTKVLNERPSVLRMDIEGFEHTLLRDINIKPLIRDLRLLYVEIHPAKGLSSSIKRLLDSGFDRCFAIPRVVDDPYWRSILKNTSLRKILFRIFDLEASLRKNISIEYRKYRYLREAMRDPLKRISLRDILRYAEVLERIGSPATFSVVCDK